MPAVFDSFVAKGYSDGVAWRLTFVVPLVITITTGVLMLVLCPDTPTGKWSERHLHVEQNLATQDGDATPNTATTDSVVDVPGNITDKSSASSMGANSIQEGIEKDTKRPQKLAAEWDHEAAIPMPRSDILGAAKGEVVQKPTWSEIARVLVSPQTTFHVLTYLCSFGGELAINAVLGSYYVKNFPGLGQTNAANWAAMFGFLNVVTRPVGGAIADLLYRTCGRGYSSSSGNGSAGGGGGGGGSVWAKKIWIVVCGCVAGAALIVVGQVDPHDLSTMVGLVTLAALFIEAGNGANFALVPHVHPHANGVVSGTTGAGGNLGGVVFAIIFRFMGAGTDYAGAFWVIGVITIALNLVLCWVPPVPKGQVGGR
ncbi:MFS general substrate transporter [Daldinia bambusicola]|nr:MFS general substrate transporter [Daldinia bambusicola]